jgi:hypothetical protein
MRALTRAEATTFLAKLYVERPEKLVEHAAVCGELVIHEHG